MTTSPKTLDDVRSRIEDVTQTFTDRSHDEQKMLLADLLRQALEAKSGS